MGWVCHQSSSSLYEAAFCSRSLNPSIASRATPPPAFDGQAPYTKHSPTYGESVTANTWPMAAWELIGGASRWIQPSAPTPLPERQSPVACSSAASPNLATLNLAPWYLAAIACGIRQSARASAQSHIIAKLLNCVVQVRLCLVQCRSVCVHAREGASVSGCCRSPPNSMEEGVMRWPV
ncbi:hypothetical protein GGI35DRAFT_174722 [Trichoderma velutinum]